MFNGSITRHKPAPGRRKNILWLDDNIERFKGQIARLSINGYQVFCCTTVADYLSIISTYFIDVAIIDLKLTGSDSGRDIVNYTNKNHPLTGVLIYSNFIDPGCDFKADTRGNLHLSVDRKELYLQNEQTTRLDAIIEQLIENPKAVEVPKEPKSWIDRATSWRLNAEVAKFSLGRILPILLLVNFAIRYSSEFDPDMSLVSSFLGDKFLIFAFFALLGVVILNRLFCPKDLRKEPRYTKFMPDRLNLYENDSDYAESVNNTLERYGFSFLGHKGFNRLKKYYELENMSHPRIRFFQMLLFLSAIFSVCLSLFLAISKLDVF